MSAAPRTETGPGAALAGLAAAGSAGMLSAAFAFQHLAGMVPCPMCVWQRWPHAVALALGLLLLAPALREARALRVLGALVMAAGAGLALWHVGVEQDWWQGPSTCALGVRSAMDVDQLLDSILQAPIVRCDEVAWRLWGVSMAGWNGLVSAGLAAVWGAAAMLRDGTGPQGSSSASQ